MEKGPPKKIERDYQPPMTVFQAVHSEEKAAAPKNNSHVEREEIEKEEVVDSNRSLDKDFLFPVYFAF